ncbi:MAG: hypothetical protein J2P27_00645, partial [Actinobacteria bacterium]|nr:hypothetical protein [Actinomycetota bacterium]
GGRDRVVLLLTGGGTHAARDVADALEAPVVAVLPHDPRAAALLSDGIGARRILRSAPLMRSARIAGAALRAHAGTQTGLAVRSERKDDGELAGRLAAHSCES